MVKNKKNMFFLQVFFYICLWIVEVFHGLTLCKMLFIILLKFFISLKYEFD